MPTHDANTELSIPPPLSFVLKVASRCNLNCTYCYVYNKQDTGWQKTSPLMSPSTFETCISRIGEYCRQSGQTRVRVVFHGGEPCLIGKRTIVDWLEYARKTLAPLELRFAIQTNGTLLDEEWASIFLEYSIDVGISLDGPPTLNDIFRIDHRGQGSYALIRRGMSHMLMVGAPFSVLSVIQLGQDGVGIHQHLSETGAASIDYLLPDFTHDNIASITARYGATPCADFLIPIFDEWWSNGDIRIPIRLFWKMSRIILGGSDEIDIFGNKPFRLVFLNTDGGIEGLDVLRVCQNGIAGTGLSVTQSSFLDLFAQDSIHARAIFHGLPLPTGCVDCPEASTCAGGYLPHRFSSSNGFDNRSVWCEDIRKIFAHLREKLQVQPDETAVRRRVLTHLN